jgi:hypothetical protein
LAGFAAALAAFDAFEALPAPRFLPDFDAPLAD